MTELDSPDNLMFQMTIPHQKNTLIKKEESRLGGWNRGQRVETRTDEVKKGMFRNAKTPHGAYIKAPQASKPQTKFNT